MKEKKNLLTPRAAGAALAAAAGPLQPQSFAEPSASGDPR